MTTRKKRVATFAALAATLLIAAPVSAAVVTGADGKPIRLPKRPPPRSSVATDEGELYVTVLLRPSEYTPEQVALLSQPRVEGEVCDCVVLAPVSDSIIITDVRSRIERLLGHSLPLPPSPRAAGRGPE